MGRYYARMRDAERAVEHYKLSKMQYTNTTGRMTPIMTSYF